MDDMQTPEIDAVTSATPHIQDSYELQELINKAKERGEACVSKLIKKYLAGADIHELRKIFI